MSEVPSGARRILIVSNRLPVSVQRTERGLEAGEVLCEAEEAVIDNLKDPIEGQILRPMGADDANEVARIHEQEAQEFDVCRRFIDKLNAQGYVLATDYQNVKQSLYNIVKSKIQTRVIDDRSRISRAMERII